MTLRKLPQNIINLIAAGEIIERPAAALKELVENSLDAKAKNITIALHHGGKSKIEVSDDGVGITKEEIPLAVQRHTTSKLQTDNLNDIHYLGFRGEALASMAAVSRLTIKSRAEDSDEAWEYGLEAGKTIKPLTPTHLNRGTSIEMRDLFFTTPARLKFLRADVTEMQASLTILRAMALANPDTGFFLFDEKRKRLHLPPHGGIEKRIGDIMHDDFLENSIPLNFQAETMTLAGRISLPTFQKSNTLSQFFFLNNRYIKDRFIFAAIRAAYADLLPSGRFPCITLYITMDPENIDVNVHPTKMEVRFLSPHHVRSQIIGAIKTTLSQNTYPAAAPILSKKISYLVKNKPSTVYRFNDYESQKNILSSYQQKNLGPKNFISPSAPHASEAKNEIEEDSDVKIPSPEEFPLGVARAHIHQNYIITQTQDGITIIDQHAAHERIIYEKMKEALHKNTEIPRQFLLIPEIVALDEETCQKLLEQRKNLKRFGLVFDSFGPASLIIREMPAFLAKINALELMKELSETMETENHTEKINRLFDKICATMACYGSIRSGRKMNTEEMDALLRQIENTPFSAQCNHGRPTYISLTLTDIEKLFSRR